MFVCFYKAIAGPTASSLVLPFPFFFSGGVKVDRSGYLRTGSNAESTHCVDTLCGGYLRRLLFGVYLFCLLSFGGAGLFGFGWLVVGSWNWFVGSSLKRRSSTHPLRRHLSGKPASSVSHTILGGWSP